MQQDMSEKMRESQDDMMAKLTKLLTGGGDKGKGPMTDIEEGIAMASLISTKSHISDAANNADSYRVLRGRVSVLKNTPDARLMPYLELAGFGSVAQIRYTVLRFDLLSALVEQWRPETHTFHFPCGECTVTLEDLLGDSPGDGESYFSGLPFTWLKAKYGQLSATATEGELMCVVRAYIMHIIGGEIMSDASNDNVHLMYLPLLADLSSVSSYSWGSTVLAVLYREFCWATDPKVRNIGGCLSLYCDLAPDRMPFLASVRHQPWSARPGIGSR
ncbi:protein MAINTENANCE OF MERISTEMS-like [Gossypium raimondii]|uniref:protein MAINTENANCE OF MERISTEMS-like n=1 Tax=Gossypium raimondii TaxID=29730 RepID=UPI00227D31CF|nr:protein MAINTENANCE OF MERISTEMS-like [Gossypium raimondii]